MEQSESYLNSSSITIDNNYGYTDEWDENEEIELGSDEHELFLKENYVKPSCNDLLPYRTTSSPTSQRNSNGGDISIKNQPHGAHGNSIKDNNDSYTKVEPFQIGDSGRGSPTSSSVVYQMPNFDQFAGNLAPSSPISVVISFIIIIVILSVTIVPKILPQAFNADDPLDEMTENNISVAQTHLVVHSDVRCKCICPPFSQSRDETPSSSSQRRLYVGNTSPDQCNCNNIVQPHFPTDTKVLLKDFCIRCECRYQSRNTTTIRRNVIFFIIILTGLTLYMLVQYLLKYFKITRRSLPRHLRWLSHQMTEG